MLKRKVWTFIIGSLVISITSCKKYEDGPLISFRSASKRIEGGSYNVAKFQVNGVDSTEALKQQDCYEEFGFGGKHGNGTFGGVSGSGCYSRGEWRLSDHGRKIRLTFFGGLEGIGPWGRNIMQVRDEGAVWDIVELRNQEMVFEIIYNNIHYKIKLCQ